MSLRVERLSTANFILTLLLYTLRVGISRFIRKIRSIRCAIVFLVRNNEDARSKGIFSVCFTFLLRKRLRMSFRQEKSYAKCTKKVYQGSVSVKTPVFDMKIK